jgi:hypothetical protein
MLTLTAENHFEDWRAKARTLLLAGVSPNEVIWEEPGQNGLFPLRIHSSTTEKKSTTDSQPRVSFAR